jgi:3-deoxy-manno-octulosonate cytidylyltransferase (CMP-KDO synthetase)
MYGRPMMWWTYQQAKKVKEFDEVYLVTPDDDVIAVCEKLGMKWLKASGKGKNGTNDIAEVAMKTPADLYVDVQGDEPIMEPEIIRAIIPPFEKDPTLKVANLMTPIIDPVEVVNNSIPKVITNNDNRCLFMTRSPCPNPKASIDYTFFKQTCIYGFRIEALKFFLDTPKGKMELIEDIELLRFVENGWPLQMVEVNAKSIAVDTKNDYEKVLRIMKEKIDRGEIKKPE